jgi:hypothetical protein
MRARSLMVALVAGAFMMAGTAFAQDIPDLPELPGGDDAGVVCDDDLPNEDDPENPIPNACDCGLPAGPDDLPSGTSGCIAVGPICLAGDIPSVTGCLSLAGEAAGGANICSVGPGAVGPCDDVECAAVAHAGCSGGGDGGDDLPLPVDDLPELPLP